MKRKNSKDRSGFTALLADIKGRIRAAQTRAILAVNAELVRLYWDIGRIIDERQQREGWGAAVVPRLARELHNELPELKGFSERNIGRMIAFYRAYPDPAAILPQPAAKLAAPAAPPRPAASLPAPVILPQPAAKLQDSLLWRIPWFHHVVLLEKIADFAHRQWYMRQTLTLGWSRNVLGLMIASSAHLRQGKALHNFADQLPAPQSDLVAQALKDPYIFDFLTLAEPFQERELEVQLLRHLERFLLELGQGFAFVGRQYRIAVGDEDFYIDLLFYHLRLRCFVIIDLKKGAFQPGHAGKMNFYLNVADDQLRHPTDAPSIGLILCQDKNRVVAEYALRGVSRPIGVSEYRLTQALPRQLQSSLPTIEAIEAELAALPDASTKPPRRKRPAPKQGRGTTKPREGRK